MPHRDDDLDPEELADSEDEAEDDTVACPYCRASIYEDAVQCPGCGHYLSREDAPGLRHSWWFLAGVVLCLLILLRWIFVG